MEKGQKVFRKKIPERSEDDFFSKIHLTFAKSRLRDLPQKKAVKFVYG